MAPTTVSAAGPDEPTIGGVPDFVRRLNPPENEIPVAVASNAVLARTDDAAIALVGAHAYTTGLRFDLVIRLREEPRGPVGHRVFEMLGGHPGLDESADRLLLGLQYADGRTVTNLRRPGFGGDDADDPDQPSLSAMGGGGGGRSFDQSFWLTPLPPAGPLLVVCAWSTFDIPETSTVIDGTAIGSAAAGAVVLWPLTAPHEPEQVQPVDPPLPEAGWFAQVHRAGDRPQPTA